MKNTVKGEGTCLIHLIFLFEINEVRKHVSCGCGQQHGVDIRIDTRGEIASRRRLRIEAGKNLCFAIKAMRCEPI